MLKIGITGGIGTGKTTVCRMFEKLGVPVYYADDRARWISNHDEKVIAQLKTIFGEDIYTESGELDRPKIGAIVFKDKEKMAALNAVVHPAVFEDGDHWQVEMKAAGHHYTLKEAALLFETGSNKLLDKIIVVIAPEDLRIARVMKRDNLTEEEVRARLRSQMPQAEKEAMADFLIHNIEFESLEAQVSTLHQKILSHASL
jgi:dephospho-CoA kinase